MFGYLRQDLDIDSVFISAPSSGNRRFPLGSASDRPNSGHTTSHVADYFCHVT
jgi:hypothetical protein